MREFWFAPFVAILANSPLVPAAPAAGETSGQSSEAFEPSLWLELHSSNSILFQTICFSSIGFSGLDGPCAFLRVPAGLTPATLGGEAGLAALQEASGLDIPIPLVALDADPETPVSSALTPEQQALLGCGPFWGTDCEIDGLDLLNADLSALFRSFPGVGQGNPLPGARGPGDPGYDPAIDGCVAPGDGCESATALVHPLTSAPFPSELAALSWNFLVTLAALSGEDSRGPDSVIDPEAPFRTDPGACSFAQPQHCSSVKAVLIPMRVERIVLVAGSRLARSAFDWLRPTLSPILLGSSAGSAALQQASGYDIEVPLVALDADPGAPLSSALTSEQQALLGCGPFWGTDCDTEGPDPLNTSVSVLIQSLPPGFTPGRWVGGEFVIAPGCRGPDDSGYAPAVDGCVAPGEGCESATALVHPLTSAPFQSEMAALSWNFLVALAVLSGEDSRGPDSVIDPEAPFRTDPGACSFAQPQYCSLFAVPEPEAFLGALAAVAAIAGLGMRRRRLPG